MVDSRQILGMADEEVSTWVEDSFDPSVGTKLWGSALVLLMLVGLFSAVALPMRLRLHQEAHHG